MTGCGGSFLQEREAKDVRVHGRRHGRDEPRVRNLPHYEPDLPRTTRAAGKSQGKVSQKVLFAIDN